MNIIYAIDAFLKLAYEDDYEEHFKRENIAARQVRDPRQLSLFKADKNKLKLKIFKKENLRGKDLILLSEKFFLGSGSYFSKLWKDILHKEAEYFDGDIVLAYYENKLVGAGTLSYDRIDVYILPEYRQLKIGSEIVSKLKELNKKQEKLRGGASSMGRFFYGKTLGTRTDKDLVETYTKEMFDKNNDFILKEKSQKEKLFPDDYGEQIKSLLKIIKEADTRVYSGELKDYFNKYGVNVGLILNFYSSGMISGYSILTCAEISKNEQLINGIFSFIKAGDINLYEWLYKDMMYCHEFRYVCGIIHDMIKKEENNPVIKQMQDEIGKL